MIRLELLNPNVSFRRFLIINMKKDDKLSWVKTREDIIVALL